MGMGGSDNYAKGTALLLGSGYVFLHSIEGMNLVRSICIGNESRDHVDFGGAQAKVFLSRQANLVSKRDQVVGDVLYPRTLLLYCICQHAIILGQQTGVEFGPQRRALGNAAIEAGHHAGFLCQFVDRRSPGFLHSGASEGIPPHVVPDDYDEVRSALFAKTR